MDGGIAVPEGAFKGAVKIGDLDQGQGPSMPLV
jgi:hypothetical protein